MVRRTREWHLQEQRFLAELLQPPIIVVVRMSQPELLIPFRFTIDQSAHTEPLRESFELTERRCSLGKIDEVGLHTSFSEEPECLTSVGVFFDPEDLYFHGAAEA